MKITLPRAWFADGQVHNNWFEDETGLAALYYRDSGLPVNGYFITVKQEEKILEALNILIALQDRIESLRGHVMGFSHTTWEPPGKFHKETLDIIIKYINLLKNWSRS